MLYEELWQKTEAHRSLYLVGGAICVLALVYPLLIKALDHYLCSKYTGMLDIEPASKPRKGGKIPGTAVIAGGSYAGLITARILSTHFEKVVVIESETLATPDQPRKNVQQYYQIHTILQYTYGALIRLFPDLHDYISSANGKTSHTVSSYYAKGDYVKMEPKEINTPWLCMTRPGFEPMMRKIVMTRVPNVEFINGTVTGIKLNEAGSSVESITYRPKAGGEEIIKTALLSDCTGPSTAGLKWLRNVGLPTPAKRSYQPNVKYWTILLPTNAEIRKNVVFPSGKGWEGEEVWLHALAVDPEAGRNYAIGIQRTEKEEVMIAFLAWGKDCPVPGPGCTLEDMVDFVANSDPTMEFFRKLGTELVAEARRQGEDPTGARLLFQQCYKLDYANTPNLPNNMVALGDARCRVNPTYGQGIAKASIGAIALDATLRRHSPNNKLAADFAKRHFEREATRVDGFYQMTKIEDYAYSGTDVEEGEDVSLGAFNRKYMDMVVKAAHKNAHVGSTLWRCINATRPGQDLFAPRIVFAVLKTWLWA